MYRLRDSLKNLTYVFWVIAIFFVSGCNDGKHDEVDNKNKNETVVSDQYELDYYVDPDTQTGCRSYSDLDYDNVLLFTLHNPIDDRQRRAQVSMEACQRALVSDPENIELKLRYFGSKIYAGGYKSVAEMIEDGLFHAIGDGINQRLETAYLLSLYMKVQNYMETEKVTYEGLERELSKSENPRTIAKLANFFSTNWKKPGVQNTDKAVQYFEKAWSINKDILAGVFLGQINHIPGNGYFNPDLAYEYLVSVIDRCSPRGHGYLAVFYQGVYRGDEIQMKIAKDPNKTIELLEKARSKGNIFSQGELAAIYLDKDSDGFEYNPDKGIEYFCNLPQNRQKEWGWTRFSQIEFQVDCEAKTVTYKE